MLDSAETGPVAGFDALIGFSLPGSATSLATPGLLQRCCAVLADGAPILLGEPVEDAFLGFLLQAAAPAMESMVHASADGSHEAIIQQFDAARAVERTVDLSDDGALRLICGRAGARHSDGALSGGNVAVIAPRDCGSWLPAMACRRASSTTRTTSLHARPGSGRSRATLPSP